MIDQTELESMRMHITRQDYIIKKQEELLDVQNELIRLLMSGQYNPIVPKPIDPNKWTYNPGPTCDCMKGD